MMYLMSWTLQFQHLPAVEHHTAGPQAGRMGSDRNYQQIQHHKQFPVPPIWLPEPAYDAEAFFDMSHAIDMGDVFIVCVHQKHLLLMDTPQPQKDTQDNTMPTITCSAIYAQSTTFWRAFATTLGTLSRERTHSVANMASTHGTTSVRDRLSGS